MRAVFGDLNSDGLVDVLDYDKAYYLEADTSQSVSSNKFITTLKPISLA